MRCQQRAKRRCPRGSSDVLEADPAPPAGARSAPGEPEEELRSPSVEVPVDVDAGPGRAGRLGGCS